MQLIGHLDSPYVRRVAVTAKFLGIPLEHRLLSIFSDYDEFRQVHPLVKVPTLVCPDGIALVDSTLIIQYLETQATNATQLSPIDAAENRLCLKYTGEALVAFEKGAGLIYEMHARPADKQHAPWQQRLSEQLRSALELLEATVAGNNGWLFGSSISHADIAIAVAWRFVHMREFEAARADDLPGLSGFAARAELLPQFSECPT